MVIAVMDIHMAHRMLTHMMHHTINLMITLTNTQKNVPMEFQTLSKRITIMINMDMTSLSMVTIITITIILAITMKNRYMSTKTISKQFAVVSHQNKF